MTEQIQKRLADLKWSLQQIRDGLASEQELSENEHSDWEEESEEERGDEPEVLDHSATIDRHNEALEHIDDAIEALNEPD